MRFFPHQLSFLIDNPVRRILISPRQLANRLPLTDSSRVLEIGPGSGYFSLEITRRVQRGHLELLDIQYQMLAKARSKLESAGMHHIGYTAGNAVVLPFPDASFDVAALFSVLGEVPEKEKCLGSVFRVLCAGGVVAFHEHLPDPDVFRLSTLRTLAENAGFKFVRIWGRWYNYTAIFQKPEA